MSLQIVTANLLRNGLVVFLAENDRWTSDIGQASIADSEDAARALLGRAGAGEEGNLVVAHYLIEVAQGETGLRAVKNREYVRTRGPSVRADLGYQAGQALRPGTAA